MKIIIEKGKISREIEGAFNICGSKKDLENLALQLNEGLKHDFFYGWIEIHDIQKFNANSKPISWEDVSSKPVRKSCVSCKYNERRCLDLNACIDHNYSHYKNSEVYKNE